MDTTVNNRARYYNIGNVTYNSDNKEVVKSAVEKAVTAMTGTDACIFKGAVSGVSIVGGWLLKYDSNIYISTLNYRQDLYTVQRNGSSFDVKLVTATSV